MTTPSQQVEYKRPLPARRNPLAAEFYDWLHKHELRLQRCTSCGTWRHMPRPMCSNCGSFDWEWARASGRGKLFTYSVAYQAMHPAFADMVPYAGAVVELEEGPRMVAVLDCPLDQLKMDMPVEVWFDDVTPDVTLAKFRPVAQG